MGKQKLDLTGFGIGKVEAGEGITKTVTQPTKAFIGRIMGETVGTDQVAEEWHQNTSQKLIIPSEQYDVNNMFI